MPRHHCALPLKSLHRWRCRRDIPLLLDPTVWGSQEEDPDWHFHYETGIYLERVGGKLYSRQDSGTEWVEVGDILQDMIRQATHPDQGLWDPDSSPAAQGEPSGSEAEEVNRYGADEWAAAPEDPEWLFNSQSGIYFHRRDARP